MGELAHISDAMSGAFRAMADKVAASDPGDYLRDDGLLMCGGCNTPKQCVVTLDLPDETITLKPRCMCRCEKERKHAEDEAARHKAEMDEIAKMQRASLMSGRMLECTFDKFFLRQRNKRLHDILRRYTDNFGEMYAGNQGLLLWGSVGTGKTFAAACVANELLARRVSVLSTSMVKIMHTDRFGDGDDEFMEAANKARLFVLDDLGAERSTDAAIERVYGVIDSRSRAGKPMIITTNLTLGQMQNSDDMRYQRVYSRVLETCYPVEVNGVPWREEAAEQRYDAMRALLEGDE